MTVFYYIGPVVAVALYVMIFQKAGFRGAVFAVCALPLIELAVTRWAIMQAQNGSSAILDYLPFVLLPLSLLPLIVLAFLRWPPAPVRPSEKSP
jgi:hypothetical protein